MREMEALIKAMFQSAPPAREATFATSPLANA